MPKGVYPRKPRVRLARLAVPCSVDGCEKQGHGSKRLCRMHYCRQWRTGQFGRKAPAGPRARSDGYIVERVAGHPLVAKRSRPYEYQHRRAYYDAHGEGPFNCHWCGLTIDWSGMHIDHLNDEKADNRLENLVASCPTCNQARGATKRRATQRARRSPDLTAGGVTKTIAQWAAEKGWAPRTIRNRIQAGWSPERAVSEPIGPFGPAALAFRRPPVAAVERGSMSPSRRRACFEARQGICGNCGGSISGRFDVDHVLALGLGGADDLDNLQVLHPECHKRKTKDDITRIAKTKRLKVEHERAEPKPPSRLQGAGWSGDYVPMPRSRGFGRPLKDR